MPVVLLFLGVFFFPWCVSLLLRNSLLSFGVFSAYFPGFLRVCKVRKSLVGVFEVFLGIFEKIKERKDRVFRKPQPLLKTMSKPMVCCVQLLKVN